MDEVDPLLSFKEEFVISDPDVCYLDGNSLGRLPKKTKLAINDFLENEWGTKIVAGWNDWIDEAQTVGNLVGEVALGAKSGQVLVCDTTSVNFYQLCGAALKARPNRKKIITDAANFPTDRYILQGLADRHDLDLVVIDNENNPEIECERITPEILEKYLDENVAFITLEVIQYRSGARNPIKEITDLARKYGALVIWDAAHAIGSVDLQFDQDEVDLAIGCTYKYGNSGPGAPAWLYVSKKIQNELQVPIQGWFAQRDQFAMGPIFEKSQDIRGFQIASPSILGLRCVKTAFEMIGQAGIKNIAAKAGIGTQMGIVLFENWLQPLGFSLNTPRDPNHRGGHLSLVHEDAKEIAVAMREISRVIPDYRAPNSIRVAISPLATSYLEFWDGFKRIQELVASKKYQGISATGTRVT